MMRMIVGAGLVCTFCLISTAQELPESSDFETGKKYNCVPEIAYRIDAVSGVSEQWYGSSKKMTMRVTSCADENTDYGCSDYRKFSRNSLLRMMITTEENGPLPYIARSGSFRYHSQEASILLLGDSRLLVLEPSNILQKNAAVWSQIWQCHE